MKTPFLFSRSQLLLLFLLLHALCGLIWLPTAHAFLPAPAKPGSTLIHDVVFNGTPTERLESATPPTSAVRLILTTDDGRVGTCMGSLITPELVLTAAHCLTEASEIVAEISITLSPRQIEKIQAENWVKHPNFHLNQQDDADRSDYMDLGLIHLSRAANPQAELMPVQPPSLHLEDIPTEKDGSYGASLIFMGRGWGSKSKLQNGFFFSKIKSVEAFRPEEVYLGNTNGKTGWCVGDSGGPVLLGVSIKGSKKLFFYQIGVATALLRKSEFSDQERMKLLDGPRNFQNLDTMPSCSPTFYFMGLSNYISWIEAEGKRLTGQKIQLRLL